MSVFLAVRRAASAASLSLMHSHQPQRTSTLRIRVATSSDLGEVHAVLSEAFSPYKSAYTPGAFADTVPTLTQLEERMEHMTILVAERRGQIDATLAIGTLKDGDEHGHLRGMAVRPSAQGEGLGRSVLDDGFARLRDMGCRFVTLETVAALRGAIALYTAYGFEPTGRVRDFFGMELFEYQRRI